jgi:hypothetical protein
MGKLHTPPLTEEQDVKETMESGIKPLCKGMGAYEIKGKGVVIVAEGAGVCYVEDVRIEVLACGTNRIVRR